jgi:polyphosphate kinase
MIHRKPKGTRKPRAVLRLRDLYVNKELSWLAFNQRVLEEAFDPRHPLLERLKFLAIFASNLDEFFMVRVALLKEQARSDMPNYSPDGLSATEQLAVIRRDLLPTLAKFSDCLNRDVLPALREHGITILRYEELTSSQASRLNTYFQRDVYPVLTPLAIDPSHPFPYIANLSVNLAVRLLTPEGESWAVVKLPPTIPRLVPIGRTSQYVLLEDLITANLGALFKGVTILGCYPFRVTLDAGIDIEEEEAEDLLLSIEKGLRDRRFADTSRVEVHQSMPASLRLELLEELEIGTDDLYEVDGLLAAKDLMALIRLDRPELKDQVLTPTSPQVPPGSDLFAAIRSGDLLLHHPYESFDPVVHFISAASDDPNVLAIKITLYRTSGESAIVDALIRASERGKQVAVLIELKARFDEELNIAWARKMENVGIHVSYGLIGLKTHAKMAMVVRREPDGLRRYVHLSTGNYNAQTARIYTDLGFFTCHPDFVEDVSELFNHLTGYSNPHDYRKLIVAPGEMRDALIALIRREAMLHSPEQPGWIIAKMNALTDPSIIQELYAASRQGVQIDLIIRGMCCLRPGLAGVSENIRVISVVGRFLEHSRIFLFGCGGEPRIYLGSADWRPRNLDRRVEVLFPIESPVLRERLHREVLDTVLADNTQARLMGPDGTYRRLTPEDGRAAIDSQAIFLHLAQPRVTKLMSVGDPHAVVAMPKPAKRNARRNAKG